MCSYGTHVVTGSWDKTIILWDIDRGEAVHQFEGHTEGTSSLKTHTSKVKTYMYMQYSPFISKTYKTSALKKTKNLFSRSIIV